ncbi:MAG: hypothetical protein ABWW69_00210, partial [Pyrodictiaceae archaeon]
VLRREHRVILLTTSPHLPQLVNWLRGLGINYIIPSSLNDISMIINDAIKYDDLIIIDEELAIKINVGAKKEKPTVLVLRKEWSYEDIIMRIFRSIKDRIREALVGVDPGSLWTVVMIADGALLSYKKLRTVQELIEYICNTLVLLRPDKSIIRIGSSFSILSSADDYKEIILNLKRKCRGLSLLAEIVDERASTSDQLIPAIRGVEKKLDNDVKAALRIALRKGISILV